MCDVNVKCPWSQIMMSTVSMYQFSSWVTKYSAHRSSEFIMGHPVQHYCQSKSFSLHDFFKLPKLTNVDVDYDSLPCSMSRYRKNLEPLRSLRPDKVNSSERILDRDCQAPNRCFILTFCEVNCALQISTRQILQVSHFFLICDGDNNKSSDYAFQNNINNKNSLLRDVRSR